MSQISRKLTRKLLFQKLFSLIYSQIDDDIFLSNFYFDDHKNEIDRGYFTEMQKLILQKEPIFIAIIEKYAPKFDIQSMNPIIVIPIYISLAELFFLKEEIPGLVSINEAIELAKTYGDISSKKIVNGILHNVLSDYNDINNNILKFIPKSDYSFFKA